MQSGNTIEIELRVLANGRPRHGDGLHLCIDEGLLVGRPASKQVGAQRRAKRAALKKVWRGGGEGRGGGIAQRPLRTVPEKCKTRAKYRTDSILAVLQW